MNCKLEFKQKGGFFKRQMRDKETKFFAKSGNLEQRL